MMNEHHSRSGPSPELAKLGRRIEELEEQIERLSEERDLLEARYEALENDEDPDEAVVDHSDREEFQEDVRSMVDSLLMSADILDSDQGRKILQVLGIRDVDTLRRLLKQIEDHKNSVRDLTNEVWDLTEGINSQYDMERAQDLVSDLESDWKWTAAHIKQEAEKYRLPHYLVCYDPDGENWQWLIHTRFPRYIAELGLLPEGMGEERMEIPDKGALTIVSWLDDPGLFGMDESLLEQALVEAILDFDRIENELDGDVVSVQ